MIDKDRLRTALQVRDRYTEVEDRLDNIAVRINTRRPGGKPNLSDFVGSFPPMQAWAIAGEMAAILGGRVFQTAEQSLRVVWGDSGYLSIAEVAERCGLAEQTIRVYRSRGQMPTPDMHIGNTPGWLPETIEAYRLTLPGKGARTDIHSPSV